jgi:predicted Zn-dependent peptidase
MPRSILFAALVAVVGTGAAALGAQAPEPPDRSLDGGTLPVVEHELPNGMRFLVLPRAGAPIVSFVVYLPVGSVHESLGRTGIAHFLEHLFFKGTTTIGTTDLDGERRLFDLMDAAHDSLLHARGARPPDTLRARRLEDRIRVLEDSARALVIPNEFDEILSREGARGLNASTSHESTQYFVQLPSNRAKLWFVMEADRMLNPVFREFYREREVIEEERRARLESDPGGLLWEAHQGAAFRVHPYGVAPIGHMDDIRNLTRAQVRDFHRTYYGPANTVVSVVGAVDPDSITAWADAYFGSLSPGEPSPPPLTAEPPQRGERRIEILHDAEPQLRIGWRVESQLHPDAPALAVLSNILVGGRDARLHRRLVRDERLATSVTAGSGPGALDPGLFTIHAVPRSPHTPEEVEATIYDELARIGSDPPTELELERIRTRLEASRVRRLASNLGLAFQIAESAAIHGDWRTTFELQARMAAVEAEDVVRVVERYLTPERRTVGVVRRPEAEGGIP